MLSGRACPIRTVRGKEAVRGTAGTDGSGRSDHCRVIRTEGRRRSVCLGNHRPAWFDQPPGILLSEESYGHQAEILREVSSCR